ncbi:hypothetical protein K8354_15515 [Polaribacter litorisediminis]|uniref:hypothetical protein n=1 Tax=Polaribacter litorisediminis TaxID=1908341 RepID=UPI001CBD1DB7|nr:hypothetical protein [Polaribacter litorisediminis]UAM97686.1 hypothetical protein K8354_15515 [Polaribacter litorisediminis]
MKKLLKVISDYSIILFGALIISEKFIDLGYFNSPNFTNLLVVIYLISSLYHSKLVMKEKDMKIQKLENQLKN